MNPTFRCPSSKRCRAMSRPGFALLSSTTSTSISRSLFSQLGLEAVGLEQGQDLLLKTGAGIAGVDDSHGLDLPQHPKTALLGFQIPQGVTDKDRIAALLRDLLDALKQHHIVGIRESRAKDSDELLTRKFPCSPALRLVVTQLFRGFFHLFNGLPGKRDIVFFIQDHGYRRLGDPGHSCDIRRGYFFLHGRSFTE